MSSMARKNSTDNTQQQHQNPENPEIQNTTTTSSSNPKSGFNNGNPVNPVELQQDNPNNQATNSMSPTTISTSPPPLLTHGPESLNSKTGLPHGPDSLNSRTGLLPTTITTTSNGGQKIAMIDQVESNCSFTDHSKCFFVSIVIIRILFINQATFHELNTTCTRSKVSTYLLFQVHCTANVSTINSIDVNHVQHPPNNLKVN